MSCPPPDPPPVVIDNGSLNVKAGFAGDKLPRVQLQSSAAIKNGCVTDWDGLTQIWRDTLTKLETTADKQPILLTEPVSASKERREKTAEIVFESLQASSIYLGDQSVLSLYSSGRMDGIVLQMGHGLTQVVSCLQGNPVRDFGTHTTLAGETLNGYMTKLLEAENISGLSAEAVRDIKETTCFVSMAAKTEEQNWESVKKVYKLPDGKEVLVGKARFCCPELLFDPKLDQQSSSPVHILLNDQIAKVSSLNKTDPNVLLNNIVVTGGTSLFAGMVDRVEKEVKALNSGSSVSVIATPGTTSSFIGGSILTCLPTMTPLWVTKEMYLESGAAIVHKKCI